MKLAPALIIFALLGCHAVKPVVTGDVPSARLGDMKAEASSMAEELNASATTLITDADTLDGLVIEGRGLAPQLADLWNRISAVASSVHAEATKQQGRVTRQRDLVQKIQSVQAQVDAQAKTISNLQAENAKLKDANRPNTKGYLALGLLVFVLGVIAFVKFDKQAGIAGMAGGGVYIAAGIFLPSLIDGAPYLIYLLYVLAGLVVVFFVYRAIRTRLALKQVVTSTEIAQATVKAFSPPIAAITAVQLKGAQDQSTSDTVNAIRGGIDPDMVKKEVARAGVISAAPEMTQAKLAMPQPGAVIGAPGG